MPGPAPNPNARRRNRESQWQTLPASCDLPVPDFPLVRPTKRERGLWDEVWHTPMANRWHELSWHAEVALYVRLVAAAEREKDPKLVGRLAAEIRQLGDRLGTTTLGLHRNRWKIEGPDGPAEESGRPVPLRVVST